MDKVALVSARVPIEIKKQGNAILKQIDSTPTQLVNSAYQYVIEHGALPQVKPELKPEKRTLSKTQANKLKARQLLMSLPGAEQALDNKDFKVTLAEGRRADYESFT